MSTEPTDEAPPAARRAEPRPVWGVRFLKAAWVVFLVVLLGVIGWIAWIYWGTDQVAASRAETAVASFDAACQVPGVGEVTPSSTESPSIQTEVIGLLGFGDEPSVRWPVLAGTAEDVLETGIGWYPQTAGVGEIGNMVLVGYRVTNGAPFASLLELEVGDRVQITTCSHVYVYVIDVAPADLTVQVGDDWVLDAVPGQPGQRPTGRMITLITSQDKLPSSDRAVGFGHLESANPR